jgi:Predicted transcriptional regulator
MLYLLLDNDKLSAQVLSERLEVSVRTVFRYVDSLSEAGFPVYVLKGRNGGIAILPQFKVNNTIVNKSEQVDILASLQSLRALKADDGQALEKLSAVFDQNPIPWLKIDPTDWSQENDHEQNFALLRQAILHKRFVRFVYINAKNETNSRLVYPIQVLFKAKAWYLTGYSMEKQSMRIFKLTRIDQLQEAKTPVMSDGSKPWLSGNDRHDDLVENVKVELLFDETLKYRIYEEFPKKEITKTDAGKYLVRSQMNDDSWLINYLLSFGSHLQVLKPENLRSKFKQELQRILANY